MDPSFGDVLRSVRQSRQLSYRQLARMIYFSHAFISHVESGKRQPNEDFAKALDSALQTAGLFAELYRTGEDEDVYRRTLMRALGTLAGIGAVAPAAVAESLRRSLEAAAALMESNLEWDSIVTAYGRGFLLEPLPGLAHRAIGDLLVLTGESSDRHRHGVRIAMVYGASVASLGDPITARRWYGTAVALADNTGDSSLRAWSRSRLAYRVLYEGGSHDEVLSATELPIALGASSAALIEAHAARAHVFASRSVPKLAHSELASAQRALEVAGDQDPVSIFSMPEWRLAIAESWTYTALGEIRKAESAQAIADRLPAEALRWRAQIDMHRAWGMVLRDDIDSGAQKALDLMSTEQSRVVRGLGRQVHSAVPDSERRRPVVRELADALSKR